jgi:GlcNAc-P-P-Und epimerase
MNICVVGGSGFIGTHLVRQLIICGHRVNILDKAQSTTFPELCTVGDVRDLEALRAAFAGIDAVVNLAAEHRDDVRPEHLYFDVNVGGAENICVAAREHDVRRIIFTSTVAIYGLNAGCPSEDSEPRPFNAYGKSKSEAEQAFRSWADEDPRRCLRIVRPVVVFGEGNRGNVHNLFLQIRAQRFIMVGDGQNKKSMAYVANLVDFLVSLLMDRSGVEIYNYLDVPDMSGSELVLTARKLFRVNSRLIKLPYSVGLAGGAIIDILARATGRRFPVSAVRIRKFCAETTVSGQKVRERGFRPKYSLYEGIVRTIHSDFSGSDSQAKR